VPAHLESASDVPVASILGGPLHHLGRRLGLVRGHSNTVPLGLAIGWSLWLVLIGTAAAEGMASRLFDLAWSGGHTRLLVAIPLFFVCETWMNPQVGQWVSSLAGRAGIAELQRPALVALVSRLHRYVGSWIPEVAALVAAVLVGVFGGSLQPYGATTTFSASRAEFQGTLASMLYWTLVPVVFRFLLFRWVWRLGAWWWFLAQVSRLPLRLLAGHPDRVGGLSGLEQVQRRLLPLVLSISVLEAAVWAEELTRRSLSLPDLYFPGAVVVLLGLLILLGPVLAFVPALWACRERGLGRYRALASRYVDAFEHRWLEQGPEAEPLLGTADLQSMADLASSHEGVRDMRLLPVSSRLALQGVVVALLPLTPLLLFQYPFDELIQTLFMRALGL
jgi:hypothetical protein